MTERNEGAVEDGVLRDIVTSRIDVRWQEFAKEHGHLAAAIERTRLIDMTVVRLGDDPVYREAMEAAGHDEKLRGAAAKLIDEADRWIGRIFGV